MPPRISLNVNLTLGVNAPLVVYIVNATHKLLPFFSKTYFQKALKDFVSLYLTAPLCSREGSFVSWSLLHITSKSSII
jgi:hypothetical protein